MKWVYDIETYPNVFTCAFEAVDAPVKLFYEVSPWRNDSSEFLAFLQSQANSVMIGFNNVGFDYPVLHMIMKMGVVNPIIIYEKAQAVIESEDWTHQVFPSDRFIPQIDLLKVHHFDNKARMTSLKALEFVMKADNVEDLPFPPGTVLNRDQIQVLRHYNQHDVSMTKAFYLESLDMIRFREELSRKFDRDFMNHNDTKIGKDFFIMRLEQAGVQCYDYDRNGRTPKQTKRPVINLNDAILPWIKFEQPEFDRVLKWLKSQSITETKGVFKDVVARVGGIDFIFGLGGIHGSIESCVVESDDTHMIIDIDVESYYPSTAIAQRFKPAHYPELFCDIYANLKEERKKYPKGSAENAMLKLALNGVYGDSNNPFSVFYDPLMTMQITLNGQLLLCYLVEKLLEHVEGIAIIQANTDGITVRIPRQAHDVFNYVVEAWESVTKLKMEQVEYKRMFIRDVNNYIAETVDGKRKFKGAYMYKRGWHQDHSALVIPKVAEKVLLDGAPIRETVINWPDKMDFMLKVKVPRTSYLTIDDKPLQRITRYYVSTEGGSLFKWMPPLKGKTDWRKIGVECGWKVTPCNDIKDAITPIDYEYYIQEVEKLCLILR
jgi:hypothetical protein